MWLLGFLLFFFFFVAGGVLIQSCSSSVDFVIDVLDVVVTQECVACLYVTQAWVELLATHN